MSVSSGTGKDILPSEHDSKLEPVKGKIKLSWKAGIAEALTKRWRRHLLQVAVVSSIVGISVIFRDGLGEGLVRWLIVAVAIFIINVSDDARLQRKASRNAWWIDPTLKTAEAK